MTLFDISFYGISLGTAITSFLFLYLTNPIRILLSFFLIIFQVFMLMLLLEITFFALLFLMFYTVLSVILLVFYMMTQHHGSEKISLPSPWYKGFSAFLTSFLAGELIFVLVYKGPHFFSSSSQPELNSIEFSPRFLGEMIYTDYPLFVVYLGILLFSALIGVVLIVGPKKPKSTRQASLDHLQQDRTLVELRDLRFPAPEHSEDEQTKD